MTALNFPSNPAAQTPTNNYSPTSTPAASTNGVTYIYNPTNGAWTAFTQDQDASTYLKIDATNGPVTGNLGLSQNLSVTGTSTFTGAITATSGTLGNLTTSDTSITSTGGISLEAGNSEFLYFKSKSSSSEYQFFNNAGTYYVGLRTDLLTNVNRFIDFPDANGTVALTADLTGYATTSALSAYLPLSGGNVSGTLQASTFKATALATLESSTGIGTTPDQNSAKLLVSGAPTSGSEANTVVRFNRSTSTTTQNFKFRLDDSANSIIASTNSSNTKDFSLQNDSPGKGIIFKTTYSSSQSANLRLTIKNNGDILVAGLSGSGNRALYASSAGTITTSSSDGTLKTNVSNLTSQADVVKALRPVTYNWIDTELRGDRQEIGFIAQEVQALVPEVIGANNDGTLTLEYAHIVPVLTKALQEALARIEALENA